MGVTSLQVIRKTDFQSVLENDVHERIRMKMLRNTDKRAAKELQDLLQEIKITARRLDENTDDPVVLRMRNEYADLINEAFNLQKIYHPSSLKASTLFRRSSSTKTIAEADNIFEEDLAAIIAAGQVLGGVKNVNLSYSLMGTKTTPLKSLNIINENIDVKESAIKIINQLMDKENSRLDRVSEIKSTTSKIDVSGDKILTEYTLPLGKKITRLMQLMKNATFSAKQYTSYSWSEEKIKDFSEIGLKLGNTNLYKAITGSLSEIYSSPKTQQHIFFRGMNTMLYNTHGYAEVTKKHFSHLRFIYELRGSGLLDSSGHIKNVKYIIYNDPSSDAIFVKDTASIIISALQSSYRENNLFGTIYLSASQIKSK